MFTVEGRPKKLGPVCHRSHRYLVLRREREATMKQRLSTLLLTLVLTHLPFARLVNAQTSVNELKQTARVRSDIRKRLSSKNTQVRVRLRNGQELHGLVDQADDRGFQL